MSNEVHGFDGGKAEYTSAVTAKYALPDIVMESTSATWVSGDSPTCSRKASSVDRAASLSSLASWRADGPYTLFSPTQNIASVCADPRKSRTEIALFFKRHWGEHFTEKAAPPANAKLHKPNHDVIIEYWKRFAQSLKRRKRCKRAAQLGEEKRAVSAFDLRAVSSPTSSTEPPSPTSAVDISSVPPFYFHDSFSFQDDHTFKQVFVDDNGAFIPHLELQQRLEHYQDAIETRLNAQLATKSKQFFKAVTTYDALSTQLAETQVSLRKLRSRMAELNELVVARAFKALSLHRARCNHATFMRRLELLATVRDSQSSVQELLGTFQYASALDVIAHTRTVLSERLSGVVCFRHAVAQLAELQSVIAHLLEQEVVRCITAELQRPLSEQNVGVIFEDQLGSVVVGLTRLHDFRYIDVFKVEIVNAAKAYVKQNIRNYLHECEQVNHPDPNVLMLGDQIRKMALDEFLQLICELINNMLLFVHKIETLHDTLKDIVSEAVNDGGRPALGVGAESELAREFDSLVPHAVSSAQDRIAKVLGARAKDGFFQRLSPENYSRVCQVMFDFCNRCDTLTGVHSPRPADKRPTSPGLSKSASSACVPSISVDGRQLESDVQYSESEQRRDQVPIPDPVKVWDCPQKCLLLRQAVQGQTTAFVAHFHDERKAKLCNILDTERWRAADVPSVFQKMVDTCARTGRLTDASADDTLASTRNYLDVNGDKYVVVGTALLLVRMLAQYCDCVTLLPAAANDLLTRAIELLKTFNSRTCQLILGAGAKELVGLTKITVRHLALASRCLQLIAYFIPFVERHFRSLSASGVSKNNSAAVVAKRVSQVLSDYNNHVQEIHNTLVSVVDDQMRRSVKEWQFQGSVPSSSFQQIGKNVKMFYENIETILPNDQTQTLLFRVHDGFKRSLKTRLYELDVTPRDGPTYALVCAEFSYYMGALRALPCCSALNDTMNDVMAGSV